MLRADCGPAGGALPKHTRKSVYVHGKGLKDNDGIKARAPGPL